MKRVAVIGASGSGKTTFAAALAKRMAYPHVELDALHWEPNWRMAELDVFRERVAASTAGDAWVSDGSYSKVRDIVWGRADTIVWLDLPLPLVLARLIRRTATRWWSQQELWGGNREVLSNHFGRDSLVVFAFHQQRRNKVSYPAALAEPAYAHLHLVHLRSPREAARWLASL